MNRIENVNNEALLIKTKLADLVVRNIEQSAIVHRDAHGNGESVLVRWTLPNMQRLASLGAPTASPMLVTYPFVGRHKPFRHQLLVCSFLTTHKRAYCFADMGTGKTLAIVHSVRYLMEVGEVSKVLVVAPLTTLQRTWVDEFFHVDPAMRVAKLHGTKQERIQLAASGAVVDIINYDGVELIFNELKANQYDCIIVDELTSYANHKTKKWKIAERLFQSAKYLWGLTGTPLLRGSEAAYGMAKLINPVNCKFRSFYEFRNAIQRKVSDWVWIDRAEAHDVIYGMLSPAIRIKKSDCIDLPPVVHIYRETALNDSQRAFYVELKKHQIIQDEQMSVTAVNKAVLAGKLLQVAAGCLYDDNGQVLEFDISERLEQAYENIIRARAEASTNLTGKTILFSPFKHTADYVARLLKEKKIYVDGRQRKLNIAVVDGEVSAKRRDKIFSDFQHTPDLDVIVAIPQTMSHGLTLTAASCEVWFAPCASSETYVQACNRVDRPGQKENMTIVNLYGSPAEWQMYRNLRENKHNQNVMLDFYNDVVSSI